MPAKKKKAVKRRKLRGRGWVDNIKNFLQKTKLISTVGRTLAPFAPMGLSGVANSASDWVDKQGYGRRGGRRMIKT